MRPSFQAAYLASVTLGGCAISTVLERDAGADGDAGADVGAPTCPGNAELVLVGESVRGEPGREQGVAIQDVFLDSRSHLFVLASFLWSSDEGPGAVRRLLDLDAAGVLVGVTEVSRFGVSWSNTASMAPVGDEIWIVTLDGPVDHRTASLVRVSATAGVVTVPLDLGEGHELGGVVVRSSGELSTDAILVVDGQLERWELSADGRVEREASGIRLASNTRLATGIRSEDRRCVAARDRDDGSLRLGAADESELPAAMLAVGTLAPFVSLPVALSGECTAAYYAPDAERPARGGVSLTSTDLRVGGWFGTAPVGLATVSPAEVGGAPVVVLASLRPDAASTIDLHWIEMSARGACSVGAPMASFPRRGGVAAPLGAIAAVRDGTTVRVVLADVLGAGEVHWGWIEPREP